MALAAVLLGVCCAPRMPAWADERTHTADEQAIRAAAKQYVEALARGDEKVLRGLWLADGDIVDEFGQATPASEVIDAEVKARRSVTNPASTGPQVKLQASAIRFLTADVAIEDGTVEVSAKDRPMRLGRFTAIWVRNAGQWRLATLREAGVAISVAGDLAALEAMVGRWSGEARKAKFDLAVQWNGKHTILERKLIVTHDGREILDATQRIAVDPLDGQIKSWMHDSDGGHSEAVWTRQGDAWVVQGTGVTPDGRRSVSTNSYTFEGPDTLVWKSTGSYSGGQKMPDFEIKLERAKGVE
jgi:hypothetical protein